jgi:hypothetical protein
VINVPDLVDTVPRPTVLCQRSRLKLKLHPAEGGCFRRRIPVEMGTPYARPAARDPTDTVFDLVEPPDSALFAPKRIHRIDGHSSPCGQVAGNYSHKQ